MVIIILGELELVRVMILKLKNTVDLVAQKVKVKDGIIGKRTRCFFNWQVGLFGFGVLFLILSLSITYSAKLVY